MHAHTRLIIRKYDVKLKLYQIIKAIIRQKRKQKRKPLLWHALEYINECLLKFNSYIIYEKPQTQQIRRNTHTYNTNLRNCTNKLKNKKQYKLHASSIDETMPITKNEILIFKIRISLPTFLNTLLHFSIEFTLEHYSMLKIVC